MQKFNVQYTEICQRSNRRPNTIDTEKDKHYYQTMLQTHPDSTKTHWNLATIYWRDQQYVQASEHWQQILKLNPHDVEALNNLGAFHLKIDQLDQAHDYFKQALHIDPKHRAARSNLACILLHLNQFQESLKHYAIYLSIEPQDPDANYNTAVALMRCGQLKNAIEYFNTTLRLCPNHIDTLCNLAAIYLKQNNPKKALDYYDQVIAQQPQHPIAQYMLSAMRQSNCPEQAPESYIKNLFDSYAHFFDQHLCHTLQYQIPNQLHDALQPYLINQKIKALDLGCGTGLMGKLIRLHTRHLIGIDLSKNMLQMAREKQIYDQLLEGEIIETLISMQDNFDLILCADTLVYFGALDQLFKLINKRISAHGLFAFSIEPGETMPYQLQPSGRYRHHPNYLQALCADLELTCLWHKTIIGRQENDQPVHSVIYITKKANPK
jgi:predicted TPR repeat methyltransferase